MTAVGEGASGPDVFVRNMAMEERVYLGDLLLWAFMRTLGDARVLAEQMREIGVRAGREVVCLLTDMDQPIGRAVGNALEIHEARDTVRGHSTVEPPAESGARR